MSRVLLSAQAAMATVSLGYGAALFADAGTPARPVVAQKQLVSGTNCQTAAHAASKPDFASKSAEYRDDVRITTRYCSATAHNQLHPTNPEIVVAGADPNASGGGDRIFVTTIPKDDAKKVHETCLMAAKAASAYTQASKIPTSQPDEAIAGADVLTSAGKVDCQDFLRATDAANPLVVLVPSAISGSVISVHILNLIGLKKPATEVQAAVDDLHQQVSGSVAMSGEEIRKRPQLVLESAAPK